MRKSRKKTNSTFEEKVALRLRALADVGSPAVVLEAFGGWSRLYDECYRDVPTGLYIDSDHARFYEAVLHRPHWTVVQADCVRALDHGIGRAVNPNVIDFDAYGYPYYALSAFCRNDNTTAKRVAVVCTDGSILTVRYKSPGVKLTHGPAIRQVGYDNLYRLYEQAAEILFRDSVEPFWRVETLQVSWSGVNSNVCHVYGILSKEA